MKSLAIILILLFGSTFFSFAQSKLTAGRWAATLTRADGHDIPIQLLIDKMNGRQSIYVVNGSEKIKINDPVIEDDSLIIRMPVFESYFKVKSSANHLEGKWVKGGSIKDVVMPFKADLKIASPNQNSKPATINLTGKWNIEFIKADSAKRSAIGNFLQRGNLLSGSILTPTGDYRYMSGMVTGSKFSLSTFDGVHALLFEGKTDDGKISGNFYSSASVSESWTGVNDAQIALAAPVTTIKEGSDGKLAFSYLDLEGKEVSLQSDKYKNK